MFDHDPTLFDGRSVQTIVADKDTPAASSRPASPSTVVELIRPARKSEKNRLGARQLKPIRQIVESVFDTLKGQLSLETTRRPQPTRRLRPSPPTTPRVDRRESGTTTTAANPSSDPHRLRPLTTHRAPNHHPLDFLI